MNYHDEIDLHVNAVAVAGGRKFTAHAGTGTLEVDMPNADNFSVVVDSFSFTSDRLANADTVQLSRIADQLANKLTYLLEPLRIVEVDGGAGAVQMRSHPPYQRQQQTRYYEVLVQRGGSLSLVRYERQPGQPRATIPAAFTKEVFHRLADDFAAAVE